METAQDFALVCCREVRKGVDAFNQKREGGWGEESG